MTVTRHTYTATLDDDTALSLKGGHVALDASATVHASASLTLAVEDAGLLAELDPRDSRRVTIGATAAGYYEKLYTPWVEQRRNLWRDPFMQTASVTTAQGATVTVEAGGKRVVRTGAPGWATTNAGQRVTVTPLAPLTLTARRTVPVAVQGSGATDGRLEVVGYDSTGSHRSSAYRVRVGGAPTVGSEVLSQTITPPDWVVSLEVNFYTGGANGDAIIWDRVGIIDPSGDWFSTPANGELERTRWLGAVNASVSVVETRAFVGTQWVPEGWRFFDFGIRSASPNRADGTVSLELASDEAILGEFAQLVDDKTPRAYEASIRAVCEYVLSKIGATLDAGPDDADVTAFWPLSNLITNPRLVNNADGWQTGSGATAGGRVVMTAPLPSVGSTAFRWQATLADSNAVPLTSRYRVTPGKWYVFAAELCSSVTRQARAAVQWWAAGGSVASSTAYGAFITSDVTAFRRLFVIAQCPPGAEEAVPYVHTTGNASGNLHHATLGMFYEGDELVPYFDGGTTDDAHYEYEFAAAAAHASASTRTPIIERRPEALTWRAGVSGMDFLQALLKTVGLRLVCDEQRKWTLRSETYRADGSQSWRYGVNITAADESVSRDDETWRDAAVYVYVWTDDDGIEQTRIDAYSVAPTPTKVTRVELRNTPYPGPGRARHMVQRAQGRGRTITVSGIPSWTEHTDQELAILLDGTPIQTGITERVRFDLDTDEVTITSRTTDTPAGAIDLLTGTINALTGTINTL